MPAFHTTTVENLVLLNACAVKKEKKKRERKNARWKKRFVVNLEERISRRVSFFLRLIVTRDYAWLGREFRKGSSLLSLYFIFVSRDSLQSNFSFSLHLLFLFLFFFSFLFFLSFILPQQIIRVQGSSRRWRRSSGFPFLVGLWSWLVLFLSPI